MSHSFNGGVDLTETDAHRVLSSARRRVVLDVLEDRRTEVALDDLSAAVASQEDDVASTKRVGITLHHEHLPMLDDVGLVDYDAEARRVEPNRFSFDDLTP